MEFQEILLGRSTFYQDLWPFLVAMGALLVIFAVVFSLCEVTISIPAIITIALGAGLIVVGYFQQQEFNDIQKSNELALVHNIQQKYDVDLVLLDAPGVDVNADDVKPQNVSVVVDSVSYTFLLTQDETTWEPTLFNHSTSDGSSESVILSAEDLLKTSK